MSNEWISVEEKLPEYETPVYIFWENRSGEAKQGVASVYRLTRHVGLNSPIDDRWFLKYARTGEVRPTHWQPLLQPPESI